MAEKGVKTLPKVLEDKKITIRPIMRKRSFTPKGHDGEFMYTGCNEGFPLPYISSTSSLANIFKEGEQEAFEELLSLEKGSLSIHKRKGGFWSKEHVNLSKEELTLDLMNPRHALWLRMLKAWKNKIAPSWNARNAKPSYKWAIVDSDEIIKTDSQKAQTTLKAASLFGDIQNSNKKMVDILRLLGKKPPVDSKKEFLQGEIGKMMSQTEKVKGVLDIHDFIKAASDPQAAEKIFVLDAMVAGAIKEEDGTYRDTETQAALGRSMQATVDYFADPSHQEDKIMIAEKIKRFNR